MSAFKIGKSLFYKAIINVTYKYSCATIKKTERKMRKKLSLQNESVQIAIKALKKNNMGGYYVSTKKALLELLSSLVPKNNTVGWGDSLTLEELGVFDFFLNGHYTCFNKHNHTLTKEEKRQVYISNFSADTFVTGTNTVTLDGTIFNIDGNGSRVAPMLYGPSQVLVVVGTNKLTENTEEAIERARQISAPLDAKRLEKHTPCVNLHKCIDCRHKERICNDFVLITGQFKKERIKVIFIDGDYGY